MKVTIEFEDCKQLMNFTEVIKFLFSWGIKHHCSDQFEDAGCGMYNFQLPLGMVLQCYPFGTEGTFVHVNNWNCEEQDDFHIGDLPLSLQKNIITELADAVHGDLKQHLTLTDDGKVSFNDMTFTFNTSTLKDVSDFMKEYECVFKWIHVEF